MAPACDWSRSFVAATRRRSPQVRAEPGRKAESTSRLSLGELLDPRQGRRDRRLLAEAAPPPPESSPTGLPRRAKPGGLRGDGGLRVGRSDRLRGAMRRPG